MDSPTRFIYRVGHSGSFSYNQYLPIAFLHCNIRKITQLKRIGLVTHILYFHDEPALRVCVIRDADTFMNIKFCFISRDTRLAFSGFTNVSRFAGIVHQDTSWANIVSMEILDLEVVDLNWLCQLLVMDGFNEGIRAILKFQPVADL